LHKITGRHSRPQFHLSLLESLTPCGREGAWRRKWECLKSQGGQGSRNKPIGCGASGADALGPDEEEEEKEEGEARGKGESKDKNVPYHLMKAYRGEV
jgi:hypothetical protein